MLLPWGGHALLQGGHELLWGGHVVFRGGNPLLQSGHTLLRGVASERPCAALGVALRDGWMR